MATESDFSSGWVSSIKPLLTSSYGSFSRDNAIDVIKLVIKNEKEILYHDQQYEGFYSAFVGLAAHFSCQAVSTSGNVSKSDLNSLSLGCRIMIKFLLCRIENHEDNCVISKMNMLFLIGGLCSCDAMISKADVLTLAALLKAAKTPPECKTGDEGKESRSQQTGDLFSQLVSVYDAYSMTSQSTSQAADSVDQMLESVMEVRKLFVQKNGQHLQQLQGREVLLEFCMDRLPYLMRYMISYKDALCNGHKFISTVNEAVTVRNSFSSLLNDVTMVWQVFSLPVVEPLTSDRLEKVATLAVCCLLAANSVTIATSIINMAANMAVKGVSVTRDEDMDVQATNIVQKSLDVFNLVLNSIKSSTRTGGHDLQNLHMLCAWCLLPGLQHLLTLGPHNIVEKPPTKAKPAEVTKAMKQAVTGKEPRPSSAKSTAVNQQCFGILPSYLASHVVTTLSALMDDLSLEGETSTQISSPKLAEAELKIEGRYSAWQRMKRVLNSVKLTSLIINLLIVAYRKGSSLSKQLVQTPTKDRSDCASGSTSDSNTFYDDDFSSSDASTDDDDDDDDDDDSEPILGHWFEETLSPSESAPPSGETESQDQKEEQMTDRKEPEVYISLAVDLLKFFNSYFVRTEIGDVRDYLCCSMNENIMQVLAGVIKDLDKDMARPNTDWKWSEFSGSMVHTNHCLITGNILNETLQDSLLSHLGVCPTSAEPWPRSVGPCTLAVLAEILVQRQQLEKTSVSGSLKRLTDLAVVKIWTRFLLTLKTAILNHDDCADDGEDVNVEHLQLLLFLFHGVDFNQKKSLFLQIGQAIISVHANLSPGTLRTMNPLPLTRLLLLLDYLLRYLYDPPPLLVQQIQYNLFNASPETESSDDDASNSYTKTHYVCRSVEDNYRKGNTANKENDIRPRFYNLAPMSDTIDQDIPKIDGLACTFLLSNPDLLNYNQLYDIVIELQAAGSGCNKSVTNPLPTLTSCALHYHHLVCTRLLAALPPSAQYLMLISNAEARLTQNQMVHTLRWASRLGQRSYQIWVKDWLTKQAVAQGSAEKLVNQTAETVDSVDYLVKLMVQHLTSQSSTFPATGLDDVITYEEIPSFYDVTVLDTLIAKVQASLDELISGSREVDCEPEPQKGTEVSSPLIPLLFTYVRAYSAFSRWALIHEMYPGDTDEDDETEEEKSPERACNVVLTIGSTRPSSKVMSLSTAIMSSLSPVVETVLKKWNASSTDEFPSIVAWRAPYEQELIPSEAYTTEVTNAHYKLLSSSEPTSTWACLRHCTHAMVCLLKNILTWCPDPDVIREAGDILLLLLFDATTEHLTEPLMIIGATVGPIESDDFQRQVYEYTLGRVSILLSNHVSQASKLESAVFKDVFKFMQDSLERPLAKRAFDTVFTSSGGLANVLLSTASDDLLPEVDTYILKFFNRLFQLADKSPSDETYKSLCTSLIKLVNVESTQLQTWLGKMIMGQHKAGVVPDRLQENCMLLQNLTSYIVKEDSHIGVEVVKTILYALIPMGSQLLSPSTQGIGFSELMVVMATLAGAGQGSGHPALFKAATCWLELCKSYLCQKSVVEKLQEDIIHGKSMHQTMLESTCYLLSYIGDILQVLKLSSDRSGVISPPFETEPHLQDVDSDWADDMVNDDDDSADADSDDDSLNNKLCTFTITQRDFMNQHWYHCHTCKMVDGVGVCNVCAKVCHKDHDISYAKYGSFFCDCGAKDDGTCTALVKRSGQASLEASNSATGVHSAFSMETMLQSSLRRRVPSPTLQEKSSKQSVEKQNKVREALCKQIEGCKDTLTKYAKNISTVNTVLELLQSLMPSVADSYKRNSASGSSARAQSALHELHTHPKTVSNVENLMTATLGSQEGAFENVRMNYSGEQGQTIRQLITAHMLRRVAMCCLSSTHGKRQHLAVSHEKGKITILQLSALLKQADSSKRKLTLTRLSSAPIPFTVLSVTGNPLNEDFLAVCGLKDCHVLTFTSNGSVADHLVLHPALETGNFIIKAVWLPGSQTQLAVVTADFVKIYDLSADAICPQYFFLLPSGKVRDCSFVNTEEGTYVIIMVSSGYICTQLMDEYSSARNGPFYITNTLDVNHVDLKDSNGQVAGGGVSVYYSHGLQLLFFSYANGKSFIAPISRDMSELKMLFPINFKSTNGNSKSGSGYQSLVQWTEIPGHPGLICCTTQPGNSPVIMMVQPDSVQVQEIKVASTKAKIQDMVAVRHNASSADQRTTLILLCEDGSLKIYMANIDQTGYWLSPHLQPHSEITVLKPVKRKKQTKPGRPQATVTFPVDFFENCQNTNDIEFTGNDVLQIYNAQQVKHRLNTNGLYVASTRPGGFSLEINNQSASQVIVGIRVMVGSQNIERSPTYLEIFGRSIQVACSRARWIDVALTREESLMADKKVIMFVGASTDPAGVTIVDSVKVYVKSKEAFGWPEESEEFSEQTTAATNKHQPPVAPPPTASNGQSDGVDVNVHLAPVSCMDRLLSSSLEVLDGSFSVQEYTDEKESARQSSLDMASYLLTLPTPRGVQESTKSLLATLHNNRVSYHNHKDQVQLQHVLTSLTEMKEPDHDPDSELYQRLVVTARCVAVTRPSNLIRFAELDNSTLLADDSSGDLHRALLAPLAADDTIDETSLELTIQEKKHFLVQLIDVFWTLQRNKPANPSLAPTCLPGLIHSDATVRALVEIINAFTACDLDHCDLAIKLYMKFLLSEDTTISFACKDAIIRALRPRHKRRRVYIPSPPRCSTPGGGAIEEEDEPSSQTDNNGASLTRNESAPQLPQHELADVGYEPISLEGQDVAGGQNQSPLEVLLGAEADVNAPALLGAGGGGQLLGGNFPPMLDIPPDADDETMMELAIALSLQDQSVGGAGLNLQGLQGLANQAGVNENSHYSDTTASAGASDDEVGSTVATDGSTLRTSPAEHAGSAGSAGSESGGSVIDSISGEQGNVSGRSSAYGDGAPDGGQLGARSETSSLGAPSTSMQQEMEATDEQDTDSTLRIHDLRLRLLEKMLKYIPTLKDVGGKRAIPFMQVLLMLTTDLDGDDEKDRAAMDAFLGHMLTELNMMDKDLEQLSTRTSQHEVQSIIMRLLSVLMSKPKSQSKTASESSTFISGSTSVALLSNGVMDYCLQILKNLLPFWKNLATEEEGVVSQGQLLRARPTSPVPDMSPLFPRQYVKAHASDVFEDYAQILTEIILKLPYQVKKIADTSQSLPVVTFEQPWFQFLSEYMMLQLSNHAPFVRRLVRKLLMFICGSKDRYRQLRDLHSLKSHMDAVRQLCRLDDQGVQPFILGYDDLITMIEHLKACADVATSRVLNWEKFCFKNEAVLPFLIQACIVLDEGVAPVILQLLQAALCGITQPNQPSSRSSKKEKAEKAEGDASKYDESLCLRLVQLVHKEVSQEVLVKFVRCFLLESNATAIRWQSHALILQIYRNSSSSQQEALLDLMWAMWSELPLYGRKAVQFVDLLGYFSLKTTSTERKCAQYVEKAFSVLKRQNQLLTNHPNANIYNQLQGLVDFDGYYLESDPCLVCNNPEVSYMNVKLTSLKVDSKFTTTTQIVKLVGSHTISKLTLRITDIKRSKMVRTINLYYNNRAVQAVVELKNKPGLWHKAKKVNVASGQTEVKVEFPLPIVACNLMIEYADFYDNVQASTETLQCPRCSASVPANPGVCSNCGENVFQCHKCRAINYDEKDPFLCNACGFCKYGKFDFSLYAKPCCAVDPIENEEDRKKAITTINSLLEKADRVYTQLQLHRPALETLLIRINEHTAEKMPDDSSHGAPPGAAVGASAPPAGGALPSNVNRSIQQLAQRYCGDCKSSFDELSKIIQKVLASRKELVDYDHQQREASTQLTPASTPDLSPRSSGISMTRSMSRSTELQSADMPRLQRHGGRCFGCSSATVEHCITLLRALATNVGIRQMLCAQGLLRELVEYNLRRGSTNVRYDVRQLLCLLIKDNVQATKTLNEIVMERIHMPMKSYLASPDLAAAVRHEVLLLANCMQQEDSCWELRLQYVMRLFLLSIEIKNPVVMETITLPCLRILQCIIHPDQPVHKKNKARTVETLSSVGNSEPELRVNLRKWLDGKDGVTYERWKKTMPSKVVAAPVEPVDSQTKKKKEERKAVRERHLGEKYGRRWQRKLRKESLKPFDFVKASWLRQALFSPSSRAARQTAANMIEAMCQNGARKKQMLDLLTSYLEELCRGGECSAEFLHVYKTLIQPQQWKYYLALQGILPKLCHLITKEIDKLMMLEETTLSSDLSLGYALYALTDLLASFVEQDNIKNHYKSRLLGAVLNGYLSLKRLIVQRTKLIDETQEKLLDLLEQMTTGTASETKEFMEVCINTVKGYPLDDLRSPVFIFERLCSMIYPEENDVGEFFISLEKDLQQEDFLQGRMLGNPYSSNEPGLGPLMRDVKNKICQDCELVALLEDDTGMELLVCNKIISLDLPVKDVYRKIWVPEHQEGEAMRIVYRMRGLLGDATEDMINSLDSKRDDDVDNEEVYKMAGVLSECDGLEVLFLRLGAIHDLVRGRPLLNVLLKLLNYCLKVKVNRLRLIEPGMGTISSMLRVLNLALLAEQEAPTTRGVTLTEQILQSMEIVLLEASRASLEEYQVLSKLCGDSDQVILLLERVNSRFVRSNSNVLQALMRLIPFLAFGDESKMQALIDHFMPYMDFDKFDMDHGQEEEIHLQSFCEIAQGIEMNANGHRLKDLILTSGMVDKAVSYIETHAPPVRTLLATDSEDWKEFISKPALRFVLRILTGLCQGHEPSQLMFVDHIPVLHKLEQASSDERIGSLAENLMEVLKGHDKVKAKIEEIRDQTKSEKKRLAMAMRQKQLGALGMTTNEKGQVKVTTTMLKQMDDLKEETGLTCCICREGYRYQPAKVLGIYTFTKRACLDDYETKIRKTQGYSTVTHFNLVHIDCHLAAVRHARGREEWESAALQNANTKCNGLLPLWGPQVPESAYASCLARHNTYLQECTSVRDANYTYTTHDLKLLLLKFAQERSFSDDSGGGGRQSNIHLVPYLMHMALYVMTTTRSVAREEKNLVTFLEAGREKWVESSYECEGPYYWATIVLMLYPRDRWVTRRLRFLERLLVLSQARSSNPGGGSQLTDRSPRHYGVYKGALMFFSLIDNIYKYMLKGVNTDGEATWPVALAEYVRHNDRPLVEGGDKALKNWEEEGLSCESFAEFCDVAGLFDEIPDPDTFLRNLFTNF